MWLQRLVFSFATLSLCASIASAQDAAPAPTLRVRPTPDSSSASAPATPASPAMAAEIPPQPETIALNVTSGTPLQIAVDQEVHVRKVGQPVRGHLAQPVYAFDHLVLPVGTEVDGRIAAIGSLEKQQRVFSYLNGDFTPARKVQVQFDQLVLSDGRKIPFHALVASGSGQVMQLVSTKETKKKNAAADAASQKIDQAKQQAKQQWQQAMNQIKAPGKLHRLERYAIQQLPVRPQYIDAGTLYSAELQEPLNFGSETVSPQALSAIGSAIPPHTLLHALLLTPLDSATTQRGAEVNAVVTQPVYDGDHLILPQGSRLKGTVVQVRPARHMHHSGQLRLAFREIVPPDGITQKVEASLEGVQAGKEGHITLDSEGGAEAAAPKSRYISTALTVTLAMTSFHHDEDAREVGQTQNGGVGGGAAGFRLVGMVLGLTVKSQPLGMAMGAYGAGRSVWQHFIARGQEVVFPQNTMMEVGIGSTGRTPLPPAQGNQETTPKP